MQTVRRLMALALFAGLFVAAWSFASENTTPIEEVHLLLFEIRAVPVWKALLAAFGAGVLLTSVLLGYQLIKKNLVARRYRKAVKSLESEIHQLRNLPLAGTGSALASQANAEGEDGEGGGIASLRA